MMIRLSDVEGCVREIDRLSGKEIGERGKEVVEAGIQGLKDGAFEFRTDLSEDKYALQ